MNVFNNIYLTFIFQGRRRYENGKKHVKFAQQASHNTRVWSEQPVDQREHEIINQNDQW